MKEREDIKASTMVNGGRGRKGKNSPSSDFTRIDADKEKTVQS
jgi:hypothetical protein